MERNEAEPGLELGMLGLWKAERSKAAPPHSHDGISFSSEQEKMCKLSQFNVKERD